MHKHGQIGLTICLKGLQDFCLSNTVGIRLAVNLRHYHLLGILHLPFTLELLTYYLMFHFLFSFLYSVYDLSFHPHFKWESNREEEKEREREEEES